MAFHEVQFPTDISYGSHGGPGFAVNIISVDSGQEQRISRWEQARRKYDVAYGVKSHDAISSLMDFYLARVGATHGFRYKDFQDFTTATNHRDAPSDTDETLGTGDASDTTFQLLKTYASGSQTSTRSITKPVASTTVVSLNDVAQASGWTVSTTTGVITFASAPGVGVTVKAGCEFDVPVRFEAVDNLDLNYESFASGSTSVSLVEILDEGGIDEAFYYGGAYETLLDPAQSFEITLANGRVQILRCTATSVYAKLPAFASLPLGGPYFYIENPSTSTQSIILLDSDDTTLMTLTAGKTVTACLTENGSSVKEWMLF